MKLKRVLIVLLILFLALAGGLYYANQSILPAFAKEKIIAGISGVTKSRVTLRDARLDILRGIIVRDLVIYDKDTGTEEILRIREISGSVLIFPWFKEKKIIIPGASLNGVRLVLRRNKDNVFNLSYLAAKGPNASGSPLAFLVQSLRVTDASVIFTDASFDEPLTYEAHIDKANIGMSWDKISWDAFGSLKHNGKQAPLEIHGTHPFAGGITTNRFILRDADPGLLAKKYLLLLPFALESDPIPQIRIDTVLEGKTVKDELFLDPKNFSVKINNFALTRASADVRLIHTATIGQWADATVEGTLEATTGSVRFASEDIFSTDAQLGKTLIRFSRNSQTITAQADLTVAQADARAKQYAFSKIEGAAHVEGNISLADHVTTYAGTAQLKCAQITGAPRVEKITDVTADLIFGNDRLTVKDATGHLLNTVVNAKADIAPGQIKADIAGECDIADLTPFIPADIKLPAYQISGAAEIKAHLETKPGETTVWTVAGETILKDVWLKLTEKNIVLASSQGRITFDTGQESVTWHMPGLEYDEEFYSCDGHLQDFSTPHISTVIIGRDIKISAEGVKNNARLTIDSVQTQFKDSHANLSGLIDLDQESFSARGSVLLNVKDLPAFVPDAEKTVTDAGLLGKILFHIASISGPLKNMAACKIKTTAETQLLSAYGYKIKDVSLDYEQIDRQGYINNLSFSAYKGQGLVKGRIDMTQKDIHYALRGTIDGLDLEQLKVDIPSLKDQTFSGTMKLNVSVQGQKSDLKTIKGGGSFQIENGNLWKLKPLQGLGTFLFIPRFELLTFTSAQGDFYIQDGFVSTDNLELNSAELGLIAEGKITFDGELDFLVNTQIPTVKTGEDVTERVAEVAQAVTKAGSLTAIKITGNVKQPQYKLQPIGENIAKKFGEILSNLTP